MKAMIITMCLFWCPLWVKAECERALNVPHCGLVRLMLLFTEQAILFAIDLTFT